MTDPSVRLRILALASALIVPLAAACGPDVSGGDDDDDGSGIDAGTGRSDAIPPPENAAVYAHSADSLYRVDPDTLEVTLVGPFVWNGGSDEMTDIAIDKDGNMVGVSFTSVYAVDKETAVTTFLADIDGALTFNGLSFVPAQSPDPNAPEILIGADASGTVFEIDPTTGESASVGSYGGGLGSSGDIVSVRGLGTVATVTDAAGTDKLARLDPGTFQATVVGDTGYDDVWGLGFWENKVFGFTDTNRFVLIDVQTGVGQEVEAGSVNWWGAAVTTTAPVIE